MNDDVTIKLSGDEFDSLRCALAYAAMTAFRDNRRLAYRFFGVVNAIHRDDPHFTPYEVPEEVGV